MAKKPVTKSETPLKIGVATIDITPPVGVLLSGYKPRECTGLGHRLRAECLVCKGSPGAWALVTSDVIGYTRDFVKAVRDKAAKATGLKPDAIMISGTHTHSGPSTISFGDKALPKLDRDYLDGLQDRLVEVIASAWSAAAPGNFDVAWTEAPTLGSNRRIRTIGGAWTNDWEDDFGRHPGYFDPTIMLAGVRRPDQCGHEALLVNYGVHPVTLGPSSLKISADYVGYCKDMLEAGGAADKVLYTLAGGGNINPRTCIKVGAEFPRRMGESLASTILDATGKLSPVTGNWVAGHRESWVIKRTRDAYKGTRRTGDAVSTEIQVLRAGDLVFVSLPGELFSEFSRMLREVCPLPHLAVVSLANDYIGYLPTDVGQAEGAYETLMAPATGLEGMILEHARKAFAAVAEK